MEVDAATAGATATATATGATLGGSLDSLADWHVVPLTMVLWRLHPHTLLGAASRVCRRWRALVQSPHCVDALLHQYGVEAHARGPAAVAAMAEQDLEHWWWLWTDAERAARVWYRLALATFRRYETRACTRCGDEHVSVRRRHPVVRALVCVRCLRHPLLSVVSDAYLSFVERATLRRGLPASYLPHAVRVGVLERDARAAIRDRGAGAAEREARDAQLRAAQAVYARLEQFVARHQAERGWADRRRWAVQMVARHWLWLAGRGTDPGGVRAHIPVEVLERQALRVFQQGRFTRLETGEVILYQPGL